MQLAEVVLGLPEVLNPVPQRWLAPALQVFKGLARFFDALAKPMQRLCRRIVRGPARVEKQSRGERRLPVV